MRGTACGPRWTGSAPAASPRSGGPSRRAAIRSSVACAARPRRTPSMPPRCSAATCSRAAGCSMSERGRLAGKVAAVTGAAAGIGEATAELFAEAGASVVLLDVDPAGEEVAARLRAAGAPALFVRTDIAREAEVAHAFGVVSERHGRLDVLVNDAAVFVLKGLEASVEDWQRSLGVNVVGTALCTRHAADVMRQSGGGAIVNLASISGFIAQPGFLTYSESVKERCRAEGPADGPASPPGPWARAGTASRSGPIPAHGFGVRSSASGSPCTKTPGPDVKALLGRELVDPLGDKRNWDLSIKR